MKKLMVLALMATLLMAGSAFAVHRTTPAPNATFSFGTPGVAQGPTTTNNDDSCDIGVAPAATLLLPYFEVDPNPTVQGQTTLFTVTNVSRFPQIAHVTLWTDWSFPVLDFNIFLTGYDVQAINLYDVIVRGIVAPNNGTSPLTTPGSLSSANTANNNLQNVLAGLGNCLSLPGQLPGTLVTAVRTALTAGTFNPGPPFGTCTTAGGVHTNAIGYVTVDVVGDCSTKLPNDVTYYSAGFGELLFDNVLIGDYEQLGPAAAGTASSSFDGAGNPMVHIRAVPEGGGMALTTPIQPGTNLPYTFYDRYTPGAFGSASRLLDRRQPLPSTFAARYIQGGTGAFATNFKIWREGVTGSGAACSTYPLNSAITITEIVRFDEHENPFTFGNSTTCSPCGTFTPNLPETSATNTQSSSYPNLGGSDVGGWMYLNLSNGGNPLYSVVAPRVGFGNPRASQNWVVIEMFGSVGANRLSVDFDAAWLGNGCSPQSAISSGVAPIGPAGGVFVCPQTPAPGSVTVNMTNGTTTQCTGTNVTP